MNNSSRVIPSIICYSKTHRLFGENSKTSLKQNLNASYKNLSRLIGYNKNNKLFENEMKFGFKKVEDINSFKFYNYQKEEIKSENIISDFLSLINKYYFEKEKIDYTSPSISVPDFYNINQKEELKLIFESIGMKNINIYNESSSITMYYGYNKYRDLFLNEEKKIDPTIEKNILFIDIGHSKTSFILSYFKYDVFKVVYVLCDDNLGGRNFDELIYNYCINEFIKDNENNENIEINDKMKLRLIEAINVARVKLTVSTEINITVESFYKNIDLSLILTREKFEELISDYIKKFEEYLKFMINKFNYIKEIEMSGEIMRTPAFQNIVEQYNIKICKTILIDECTSVGSALLNNFYLNDFPIKHLKYFFHFNYYEIHYKIVYGNINLENVLIYQGMNYENDIPLNNYNNENIIFELYYIQNGNKFYQIELSNLGVSGNISFKINIHDLFYEIYFGNKVIKKEEITLNNKDEFIKRNKEHIMKQNKIDLDYNYFINEKMKFSKIYYFLKNIIKNNDELKDEILSLDKIDNKIKKDLNHELIKEIKNDIDLMINNIKNKSINISNTVLEKLNEYQNNLTQ